MILAAAVLTGAVAGCQLSGPATPGQASAPPPEASVPVANQPFERITPEAFRARQQAGETFVIVDVRSAASYAGEHIEGAVNAPWGDIQAGKFTLPKDQPLLLYCT